MIGTQAVRKHPGSWATFSRKLSPYLFTSPFFILFLIFAVFPIGYSFFISMQSWNGIREMLASLSRSRVLQGFKPSETANFVFSLKKPLLTRLRRERVAPERVRDVGDRLLRADGVPGLVERR